MLGGWVGSAYAYHAQVFDSLIECTSECEDLYPTSDERRMCYKVCLDRAERLINQGVRDGRIASNEAEKLRGALGDCRSAVTKLGDLTDYCVTKLAEGGVQSRLINCHQYCVKNHGDDPLTLRACTSICNELWSPSAKALDINQFKACFPNGLTELEDFKALYRDVRKGGTEISNELLIYLIISVISKMLEDGERNKCPDVEVAIVKLMLSALSELGIDRFSVRNVMGIDKLKDDVRQLVMAIFPNAAVTAEAKAETTQQTQQQTQTLRRKNLKLIKSASLIGFIGSVILIMWNPLFIAAFTSFTSINDATFLIGLFAPVVIPVIVALYMISRAYGNKAIWRNTLYALIAGVVGMAIYATIVIIAGPSINAMNNITGFTVYITNNEAIVTPPTVASIILKGGQSIGTAFVLLTAMQVAVLMCGWFIYMAYKELSRSSRMASFNWAGRLYLVAAMAFALLLTISFLQATTILTPPWANYDNNIFFASILFVIIVLSSLVPNALAAHGYGKLDEWAKKALAQQRG